MFCRLCETKPGIVKLAKTVMQSLIAKSPELVIGKRFAGPVPNNLTKAMSLKTESVTLAALEPANLGMTGDAFALSQAASMVFAVMYVPLYTPQMSRKLGCRKKEAGLQMKDFNPS